MAGKIDKSARTLIAALLCFSAPANGAVAAKDPHRGVHTQVDPAALIARVYPQVSSIAAAIAIVPDPLVPRYRRPYDLSITAIELGMLRDGYVLDRYSFPWNEELQQGAALNTTATPGVTPVPTPAVPGGSRNAYGLMVFRCDSWRGDVCGFPRPAGSPESVSADPPGTQLRTLYIVTNTATQGVAPRQLRCAIEKIRTQLPQFTGTPGAAGDCPLRGQNAQIGIEEPVPREDAKLSLLTYPGCQGKPPSPPPLIILGPNFSGAMDSVGAAVSGVKGWDKLQACLISSSATDTSNVLISTRYEQIKYFARALPDVEKLAHLSRLIRELGVSMSSRTNDDPHRDIAILTESSTFGYGVCHLSAEPEKSAEQEPAEQEQPFLKRDHAEADAFCAAVQRVYFPATIADIRFGLQKQVAQQSNDLAAAAKQVQPTQHLSLEAGAENGSEFPESLESTLTSASDQLQLDKAIGELTKVRPRIVIVAATDVRDRLFLFDQLRALLPRAMLIDLETDNLLTHPDFLHASRGALAVASANVLAYHSAVFGCEWLDAQPPPEMKKERSLASWSTDAQAILSDTVARLSTAGQLAPPPCLEMAAGHNLPRQAALQAVTFNGFRQVTNSFAVPAGNRDNQRGTIQALLREPPLLKWAEIYAPIFCLALSLIWLWPGMPGRLWLMLLCAPMPLVAMMVAWTSTRESSHFLSYAVVALAALGICALLRCHGRLAQAYLLSRRLIYSTRSAAIVLGALAVMLSAAPLLRRMTLSAEPTALSEAALTELGFDPTSGLGFYLVIALATLVALGTSAMVVTEAWMANWHWRILFKTGVRAIETRQRFHGSDRLIPLLAVTVPICMLTLPGFFTDLGGARLTVFGSGASQMAQLALLVTTVCAAILLCATFAGAQRLNWICGYVRCRLERKTSSRIPRSDNSPGLWEGCGDRPVTFAATPVMARLGGGGTALRALLAKQTNQHWSSQLRCLLNGSTENADRLAWFALLAAQMSLFRWAAAGSVMSALASVIIVYLYPIESDPLVLLNLAILVCIGIFSAYKTTSFERNEVLSNILCNRPRKLEVSTSFFLFIAAPFIALAAAIVIVAIPGVVDWAGGLLAMLGALGVHP